MTGFREKQVLSFYSQHFLYHIYGKLCPGGRGPQFVFSLQLGSCGHAVEGVSQLGGHAVEGVSWSRGHVVLRNWHSRRNRVPTGRCGRPDFIPCLSGHHSGPYFNHSSEPLVSPDTSSAPQQGPALLLTEARLASHCSSALILPET